MKLTRILFVVIAACLIIGYLGPELWNKKEESAPSVKKAEAPERQGWDNENYPLYGDVARMTVEKTKDNDTTQWYVDETYCFNDCGDVTSEEVRISYNQIVKSDLLYDSAGLLTEKLSYYTPNKLGSKITYSYDAEKQLLYNEL